MNDIRWLYAAAALAAGEGLASFVPSCAEAWPVVALALALTALFGWGLRVAGLRYAVLFLFGLVWFLMASLGRERAYRERPWLRNARRRAPQQEVANAVRREFSRRIGIGLEHDRSVANLNRAILLGERNRLPRGTRDVFVASGTMHVFAISGLHVMMVAKVLVTLLACCFVPYRWVGLAAVPLLWGYVVTIGSPPSAVRAAAMATFYYLAPVFWRRPNGIVSWSLTFFVVYLVSPQMIADVGCALSFAVMLAIVLTGRVIRDMPEGVRKSIHITFAAWAAGVPIAAHVFGRVTPGGLLANIPLLFAAEYSVVTGFVGILASSVSETLAAHFNNFSALFTKAMVGISEGVSRLPGANFETGAWSLLQCAEWYALFGLVLYLVRSVRSRRAI